MLLLSSADIVSKSIFSKNSSRNTIRISNSLDPDQDRQNVCPDLGPNCLQKLSADDKSRSEFCMLLLSSADIFQTQPFQKILSGIQSEFQTVWIQIRTDILSVLIWVQTVCKGCQQTTKVAAGKVRVKSFQLLRLG